MLSIPSISSRWITFQYVSVLNNKLVGYSASKLLVDNTQFVTRTLIHRLFLPLSSSETRFLKFQMTVCVYL